MSDHGWVVQVQQDDGTWETEWWTTSVDKDEAIDDWTLQSLDYDAFNVGHARLVRCVAVEPEVEE